MTFAALVSQIIGIINLLVGLLGTVALAVFLWGGVRYMYLAGESTDKEKQKEFLRWGLIAMFVLVSVFGILQLMQQTFLPS